MAYELITNRDSRNFTPAASVQATFGRPRVIKSITIHWWGLPEWGDTFDGVCNFLCTNTKPTSAHEVIEAGRVAVLVNHGDASWAAGNAVGNAESIHLECRPRASEADYATVAERVRDLRTMYGDLPLVPHRDWQATQCPGVWDLAKIDQLARGMGIAPTANPAASTPTPEEGFLMALTDQQQKDVYWILCTKEGREYLAEHIGGRAASKTLNTSIKRGGVATGTTTLGGMVAWNDDHVSRTLSAVAASAASDGASVEQIQKAVKEAMASVVKVEVSVEGGK